MRTYLTILTALWIAGSVFSLPILYLLVGFSGDSASGADWVYIIAVFLFYLQLLSQSIVAMALLRRIVAVKQYLIAVLLILLPPVLILPIGLTTGISLQSDSLIRATLISTLGLELAGSVWMWALIATKRRAPILPAPVQMAATYTSAPTPSVAMPAQMPVPVSLPEPTPQPLQSTPPKHRLKKGHIVLMIPAALFTVYLGVYVLASALSPDAHNAAALTLNSPLGPVINILGILLTLLLLPCIIIGIVLLKKQR